MTALATVCGASMILAGCGPSPVNIPVKTRVALIDGGVDNVPALSCYTIEQHEDVPGSDHGTAMTSVILNAVDVGSGR